MADQPVPANIEFSSTHQPDTCTGETEIRTPPSDGWVRVHCQKDRHRPRSKHEFKALNPATGQTIEIYWTDARP